MENITRKFSIARAIHGLDIVTFVMLFVISSMIFYSHNLFLEVLPATMEPWQREVATWLMALGWEWTVLVTTCNPKYIHTIIPKVAALASALIVLFFVQAFDFSQTPIVLAQRWLMGSLAGTMNLVFARLFHEKWMDLNLSESLPGIVDELKKEVADLKSLLKELQSAIIDRDLKLKEFHSAVVDRDLKIKELHSAVVDRDLKLKELQSKDHTNCPYCDKPHVSVSSMIAHKRHCQKKNKHEITISSNHRDTDLHSDAVRKH